MSAAPREFCQRTTDGVRLFVRVSPRASRDRLEGIEEDASGQARLRIRVTAPPDDGAANDRVTALIAKALRIAPSSISIRQGLHNRSKVLDVAGNPETLMAQVTALAGDRP